MINNFITYCLNKKWNIISFTLLAIVTFFYINNSLFFWNYINDDAYITYRYSYNFAKGFGPIYNINEHVEGYSNFSLMTLLAFLIKIGIPQSYIPFTSKIIGILSGILIIIFSYIINKFFSIMKGLNEINICLVSLAPTIILSCSSHFAVNSVTGLETTFFSLLIILGVYFGCLNNTPSIINGIIFGLICITRPEGIAIAFCYAFIKFSVYIFTFSASKKIDIKHFFFKEISIILFCFLGLMIFRLLFYNGEFFPNTFYAKKGGANISAYKYIYEGIIKQFYGFLGIILSFIGLYFNTKKINKIILQILFIALAGISLPFFMGTDWMIGYRFIVPYIPLAAIVITFGWLNLFHKYIKSSKFTSIFILLICFLSWQFNIDYRKTYKSEIDESYKNYQSGHIKLSKWIKNNSQPNDLIAAVDIGILGFECINQRILDISGLTDRNIAKNDGNFLNKLYDLNYIENLNPKFIIITITKININNNEITFKTWTPIEYRIFNSVFFNDNYINYNSSDNVLCNSLGAIKVFEYNEHYNQFVFKYNK